jgi:prepilin-type N-terminal cleavage/methylation domain-containing protein/prepilin-type processing-associated H-X9-DG protein
MKKAFTLIELLVVISIIALLIAILMPALTKAQQSASSTQCLANVRQLSAGISAYSYDYNGKMIPAKKYQSRNNAAGYEETQEANWFYQIRDYIGDTGYAASNNESSFENIGLCPDATTQEETGTSNYKPGTDAWTSWVWTDFGGSYGINNWLQPDGDYYKRTEDDPSIPTSVQKAGNVSMAKKMFFKNIDTAKEPSSVPVTADSRWVGGWPEENDFPPNDPRIGRIGHGRGYFMGRFTIDRHNTFTVNASFIDGHAEPVSLPDLWQLNWHNQWVDPAPVTVPKPY